MVDAKSKYTLRYRVLKTILFHCAFLSLGLISEIYGVTYEDLRILLDANYQLVGRLFIGKIVGYIVSLSIVGCFIDSYLKYCDLFIALANLALAIRELIT